jgi:hypothetical protein
MADPASTASVPRELLRILRRHPRQLPERLMLFAVQRLGEPTRAWAERVRAQPDADLAARRARSVHETIVASRVDGAVAGTPFFIALVPAYVTFLWTQARMVLQLAALQGRDTTDPAITAELLALRGIHPTVEAATEALAHLDEQPPAPKGMGERFATWVALVRRILVLAAFVSPSSPDDEQPRRARQVAFGALGLLIWAGTYVFPVTFMVVMAWGCESSTRQLGAVALDYYAAAGGAADAAPQERSLTRARRQLASTMRSPRRLLWTVTMGFSIAVPLLLIAAAVSKHGHHGKWVAFVAPIAGLALVLALARAIARRD